MKEMLEFMDELQVDLDEANAAKANLEDWAKAIEDQVAKLHRQVQMLQAQAQEIEPLLKKVAELESELQRTVARGGEMFVEGQDSVKE